MTRQVELSHARWTPSIRWFLDGTYLMLEPNAAGGWFVVDVRNPGASFGMALDLDRAKRLAVQVLERRLDLKR